MLAAAQDGFMNATDLADYLVERGIPFAMPMRSRVGSFGTVSQGLPDRRTFVERAERLFKENRERRL